ncbi:MAG: Eco57I restriction-modification methylase domain-containing protein, partial [Verrucomicrobiaceae bacterium]
VLDPACGASVFLVIAFRRLYRELWKHTKKRPDTDAIRSILENQLVGFDICDSALKLSALSLYLTAIELDPEPVPPEKLKFKALCKGKSAILFDWSCETDKPKGPVVGSIGSHVERRFDNSFDLVLCNPPWTNIGSDYPEVSKELDELSTAIVTRLDPEIGKTYKNPYSVPDLPFVWKSMEWCKPDGRIAMALPARTLFKQGPMAETTRKALFRLLEVNGIINCSNLRKTVVWPDMDQPFMLLFARNRRPKPHHRLHFISPHTDLQANSLGEMRIDDKSAQLVDVEQTIEEPWLWKALALGTILDVEVVRKIKAADIKTLEDYWENELHLSCSNGYSVKTDPKPSDCRSMKVLKDLRAGSTYRFCVDVESLPHFDFDQISRPRLDTRKNADDLLRVYRGPLALIKECPGPDRTLGWALLCENDVAYNQSFYGYSAKGAPDGKVLVRYLQLFVHSQLWQYYALMTSAKLGFERPNVYKADLDNCPFLPFGKLDKPQRDEVKSLSSRLIREDRTVFHEIDTFFGKLYGLSNADAEVIADTLEVRDPNDELGKRASQPPKTKERGTFCRRLETHLRPLFKALGKQPEVTVWKPSEALGSPFVVFTLTAKGDPIPEPSELFRKSVLPLANETGATRIIKEVDGGLMIAVLRQYRYWTPSRARLLGAEIMRNYMTVFED